MDTGTMGNVRCFHYQLLFVLNTIALWSREVERDQQRKKTPLLKSVAILVMYSIRVCHRSHMVKPLPSVGAER